MGRHDTSVLGFFFLVSSPRILTVGLVGSMTFLCTVHRNRTQKRNADTGPCFNSFFVFCSGVLCMENPQGGTKDTDNCMDMSGAPTGWVTSNNTQPSWHYELSTGEMLKTSSSESEKVTTTSLIRLGSQGICTRLRVLLPLWRHNRQTVIIIYTWSVPTPALFVFFLPCVRWGAQCDQVIRTCKRCLKLLPVPF